MTLYVDVGAKRIQAYLARTPSLKGRRGASHLLDRVTLYEVTAPAWQPIARPNPEAKRTDGLVCFRLPDDDLDAARELVTGAVRLLRRHAPGAEWEVTVARGSDYQDAQHARKKAEKTGRQRWMTDVAGPGTIATLAPLAELPVVRLCASCGLDPAVGHVRLDNEDQPCCADCLARLGRFWEDTPAEKTLLDAVRMADPRLADVGFAGTFEDLATTGADPHGNHLCTVFADGNRFGALFTQLTGSGVDLGVLSDELTAAMTAALTTATRAVTPDDPAALPVIPHLVGGDDLLASVTADKAWTFTRTLLADYRRRVQDLVTPYGMPETPTASAGIVFAHAKFPLATSVALAESALAEAKARHAAQQPAILWADVTAEGPRLTSGRRPPTLDELDQAADALTRLAGLAPSTLSTLGDLATRPDPETLDVAAAQAHRLGVWETLRPFLSMRPMLPLPDALSILRWWRP